LLKSLVTASVALAFAASAPALAKDESTQDQDGHEQASNDGEAKPEGKKVCRMQTDTGSVMPKRVCRIVTKASSKEEERQREEALRSRPGDGRIGG
jgi:hypothetical protein